MSRFCSFFQNFLSYNSARRSIPLKNLGGMTILILILYWVGNRFDLPLNADVARNRDEFLQILPSLFPNDRSIEVSQSGKNGGIVYVLFDGGYVFDANLMMPDKKYATLIEGFGFVEQKNNSRYYCKDKASIEFSPSNNEKKWLMVWRYPNSKCKVLSS